MCLSTIIVWPIILAIGGTFSSFVAMLLKGDVAVHKDLQLSFIEKHEMIWESKVGNLLLALGTSMLFELLVYSWWIETKILLG